MLIGTAIYKRYGDLEILRGLSIEVQKGQVAAIVGPSGCGKSTLLHVLGTLDRPDQGQVLINGTDVLALGSKKLAAFRNRHIGFVFQFHHLLPEFTALENIALPQMVNGLNPREARARAAQLLDYLKLGARAGHRPFELSGGEQQRVAIARAVANAPDLLLADEPTGNLDPRTAEHAFETLLALARNTGLAALIATHNLELAEKMDRRVTLRDGRIEAMP